MKRLYSLGLFLAMLIGLGFNASADVKVTLKWDIPGSVKLQLGSTSGPFVDLAPDQTEYVFDSRKDLDSAYGHVYAYGADGYVPVGAENLTTGAKYSVSSYGNPPSISMSFYSSADGSTVQIEMKAVERTDKFNIDVVNGLNEILSAEFKSGYTLDLQQGEHEYYFNAEVDNPLTITFMNDVENVYKFTNNLEDVELSYGKSYQFDVTKNDDILIQVFENNDQEKKDCKVNFTFPDNDSGYLQYVYNKATGKFVEPSEFEDGGMTVTENTHLTLFFPVDDYTVTGVKLNGEALYISQNQVVGGKYQKYAECEITDVNSTIEIEGHVTVYAVASFTGYISNPEGVVFAESMDGPYDIEPEVTGNGSGGDVVMPADTKTTTVKYSSKYNKVFFRPKDGYFITGVYTYDSTPSVHAYTSNGGGSAIMNDNPVFYMKVEKMEEPYNYLLNVTGTSYNIRMYPDPKADASGTILSIAGLWGNPEHPDLDSTPGEREVSFIPNYDSPVVLKVQDNNPHVYLDGAEVSYTTDSNAEGVYYYTMRPYAPAEGESSEIQSVISVYNQPSAPTMSGASVEPLNGAHADFYYSPIMHQASISGQAVLPGTLMTVKNISEGATVVYGGKVQTLDENGQFQFYATGNARNNVVTVALPQETAYVSVKPDDDVKALKNVTLTLPAMSDDSSMEADMEVLAQAVIKNKSGEQVATLGEVVGDPACDETTGNMSYSFAVSPAITEEGKYYVVIPVGAFVQRKWDNDADAFVNVPGGYITKAVNQAVVVDPSLLAPIDKYSFFPEDGTTVNEIAEVTLSFPEILPYGITQMSNEEGEYLTFKNGEKSVNAIFTLDWNNDECTAYIIKPVDGDEQTAITEGGTWTLTIPAGTFTTTDGDSNEEITAKFIVEDGSYKLDPASGSSVSSLSTITITFPGVATVEENEDIQITLAGGNATQTANVGGVGNARTLSFRNPSVAGEYVLTIPEGAFTLDGEASEFTEAVYTFAPEWELTPAPGSTIDTVEFTLSFPNATNVEYVGRGNNFAVKADEFNTMPGLDCVEVEGAEVPTFKLTAYETAAKLPNGTIELSIEEGTFTIDGKPSNEIIAEYTLEAEVSSAYQVDPNNGTIVNYGYGLNVTFIFDEGVRITTPASDKITVTFNDEVVPANKYEMMVQSNMLMIGFYTAPYSSMLGKLKISIEAGAIMLGDEASPLVEAEWDVVEYKEYIWEATPAGEVSDGKIGDLSTITLTFPEADTVEIFNEYGASLRGGTPYSSHTGRIEVLPATRATGASVAIHFDDELNDGNYTLNVMEGTLLIDGVYGNPEVRQTYFYDSTMTGINSIFADENGNVTVVAVDGKVVLNNVPAAQLRELQKGLYIINGKKTIVK